MRENMGFFDKLVRLGLAILLMFLYSYDVLTGILGIIALVLVIILALTSLIQLCPIYKILGMSTSKNKEEKE